MGDRGSYSSDYGKSDGIPPENRQYSEVGRIGNIKVIQSDATTNNRTPTYSNTCNTTYFSYSKERDRIESIYYYRNHRLVKSVDFGKSLDDIGNNISSNFDIFYYIPSLIFLHIL